MNGKKKRKRSEGIRAMPNILHPLTLRACAGGDKNICQGAKRVEKNLPFLLLYKKNIYICKKILT